MSFRNIFSLILIRVFLFEMNERISFYALILFKMFYLILRIVFQLYFLLLKFSFDFHFYKIMTSFFVFFKSPYKSTVQFPSWSLNFLMYSQ